MITRMPPMSLPDHLMTMDDLLPGVNNWRRDITAEMNQRFFVDLPDEERHQIEWRHGCIVGKPGCGKSETFRSRAEIAVNKYGASNVNIIYTDDLRVALDMIDDRPVQYAIIDDASKCMSSRQVFEQTEVLGVFNRLRHHFRDFISTESGVFLCEFGWQRWSELDPGFRDGTSLIFKTNMSSDSERRSIQDFIGPRYMSALDDIWDSIDRGVQTVKSYGVGRIGPKPIDRGGVGIYHLPMTDWDGFPDMVVSGTPAAVARADAPAKDPLEAIRGDPSWSLAIECYERSMAGEVQREIASDLGISRQKVSRLILKVRDCIDTRNGEQEVSSI